MNHFFDGWDLSIKGETRQSFSLHSMLQLCLHSIQCTSNFTHFHISNNVCVDKCLKLLKLLKSCALKFFFSIYFNLWIWKKWRWYGWFLKLKVKMFLHQKTKTQNEKQYLFIRSYKIHQKQKFKMKNNNNNWPKGEQNCGRILKRQKKCLYLNLHYTYKTLTCLI